MVLLSGGLDSATVLAMAIDNGCCCYTLSIDYGQRHRAELDAAAKISVVHQAIEHRVVRVDYGQIGGSALLDETLLVPTEPADGIPVTYVPARNTMMLSIALGWAEVLDASAIFIGVNAVDYSGYPDCRPAFISSFETLANLATKRAIEGQKISIEAPLLSLNKGQIIERGIALGVDYASTVSCYQADNDGRACGLCDACRFRRSGFERAGIVDPTRYQTDFK